MQRLIHDHRQAGWRRHLDAESDSRPVFHAGLLREGAAMASSVQTRNGMELLRLRRAQRDRAMRTPPSLMDATQMQHYGNLCRNLNEVLRTLTPLI